MNLCEFPFATVSNRSDSRTVLRFETENIDKSTHQPVQRTLIVKGDPEFGLPTAKDEEIYLGLLKQTHDINRFTSAEVGFQRSGLLDLMGWSKSTRSYRRLTLGMHRLTGVRMAYQNLWRDNGNKVYRDQEAFGIPDSFEFRDHKSQDCKNFRELSSLFRWSAVRFDSFDSGYIKRIDYTLMQSLHVTARRLYRYLDKHFHPPRKTEITKDLAELAYQHIGISTTVALDKVRNRHIGPAIDELQGVGFLSHLSEDSCFVRLRPGKWNVIFRWATERRTIAGGKSRQLIHSLCKRGLDQTVAVRMVASNSEASIRDAIGAMDEQIRTGNTIRDPQRWFQSALKNGFRPNVVPNRVNRPELRVFRSGHFVD